jgi:thiol:disulfide interchange protein DsbD
MIGAFLDFNSSKAKRVGIWTSAIVIMALSYVVTMEGWLQLRERNTPEKTLISETGSGIKWNAFSVKYLEETVSKGKPVFIDFTADWCFTCKVTEQTVIETDLVRRKLDEYAITPIKADWTSRNDEITSLLKQYGRSGVPLYVVIPGGRLSDPIILPEVITQSMLIDAFRDARAQTLSSALQ